MFGSSFRYAGILALSMLVVSTAFGLTMALDLWTSSVERQEARRALQLAARRAARDPYHRDLLTQVGETLREMGHLVAPKDLEIVVQRPAARLVWRYPSSRELTFQDPRAQVVTYFLPAELTPPPDPEPVPDGDSSGSP